MGASRTGVPPLNTSYILTSKIFNNVLQQFRDREAKAAKVAREIEGNTSTHLAAELENGDDDEENAFSAVQREPSQRKHNVLYYEHSL